MILGAVCFIVFAALWLWWWDYVERHVKPGEPREVAHTWRTGWRWWLKPSDTCTLCQRRVAEIHRDDAPYLARCPVKMRACMCIECKRAFKELADANVG